MHGGRPFHSDPWEGRWRNYAMHEGMRVPQDGEVAWLLPEGSRCYCRIHFTGFDYMWSPEP